MDSKIRKKFYKITHATFETKGYAWASTFWPNENMPFVTKEYIEDQLQFWRVNGCPPSGLVITNGGARTARKWPDFLGSGGGTPNLFVSNKVVDSLDREGIPYSRLSEIPISKIDAKDLIDQEPPKYYVLEVEPGLHLNYEASLVPVDEHGAPQFRLRPSHFGVWNIGRLETWNGSDLFAWKGFPVKILSNLLCTDRIIEIAKKYKWTNVKFDPVWAQ